MLEQTAVKRRVSVADPLHGAAGRIAAFQPCVPEKGVVDLAIVKMGVREVCVLK